MKTKLNFLIFLLLLLSGCKISYLVSYENYIEGTADESLQYSDSTIKITFIPRPNGIAFDIENLTKNNLYLIWDKSYFIEPNGSSSKPLNTDILETNSAIREKENYESVIPQKAHFSRFTSAATKLSEFSIYNSLSLYDETSKSISTTTEYSKFYSTGKYWYTGSKRSYSTKSEIPNLDKQEITTVKKYITNNDNLAVGFTIKNKEQEKEYHFKFPIKKAIISKKTVNDFAYLQSYELNKENAFNAIEIKREPNTSK